MADSAGRDRPDPGVVLAAAALVLSAFPVVAVGFGDRPGPYLVQTYLFWSDLPLLALGVLCLPELTRRLIARRLDVVTAAGVLVAALAVAWAVHPSLRGGLQVLRFLGVAGAVVATLRGGPSGRRLLAGALACFTAAQVVLAVAQRAGGGPVGLAAFGEQEDPLVAIGGARAPQGTLVHPYLLAGLGIVTIAALAAAALHLPSRARVCAVAAGVAGVAVGLTYSRAALVALVGLVVSLALAIRRRGTRAAAVAVLASVVIGFGVTAAIASDGWVGRAEEAAAGSNLTRGRSELAEQAVSLLRRHPLVGVGTGRYVLAVEEDEAVAGLSTRVLQPVHAVPLLLVAEGGVLVALALALVAVALVRAARRGGAGGWALLLGYTPFLLLDHFPATFPQGLAITAAWLAAIAAAESAGPPTGTAVPGDAGPPAELDRA